MSNKIIGINEYGSFAKNEKNENVCHKCMYFNYHKHVAPCKSCLEVYYYPNHLEATKLESEISPETFTINDMYVTSKQLFDCQDELKASQKELIDLQNENKQLKEKIESINQYLDNRISECNYVEKQYISENLDTGVMIHIKSSYQNVKEFIKNHK